jgi:hypothetical protein
METFMTRMPFLFGTFLFFAVLKQSTALAIDELSIVDVRRHITLADDDVVYKDFYLNGGEGDGLKKNLVVTAVRKIQVRDSSGSQSYGEILVPVGQLRVIAIYGKVAVAREYKLLSRDELPMLEQTGLMSGDRIDLKGAFVDNNKPKYKKPSVASAVTQPHVLVATLTTAPAAPTGPAATAAKGPRPASVPPAPAPAVAKKASAPPPVEAAAPESAATAKTEKTAEIPTIAPQ